jgi:hypothetical protein
MAIKYDSRTGEMKDDDTGVIMRMWQGPDFTHTLRYFDPTVTITPKGGVSRPSPGTVELHCEEIYSRAPIATVEGRLNWGRPVGWRVVTYPIHQLYQMHLGLPNNDPEVLVKLGEAKQLIHAALIVRWQAAENETGQPIVDLGEDLSVEVRCFIPRFPIE